MTQEQATPPQVQIPGDTLISLQLTIAKIEQLVIVLNKQSFESVSNFLPEILMQANAQLLGMVANAKAKQETTQ